MTKDEKDIWVKFAVASLQAGRGGKYAANDAEHALEALRKQEMDEVL